MTVGRRAPALLCALALAAAAGGCGSSSGGGAHVAAVSPSAAQTATSTAGSPAPAPTLRTPTTAATPAPGSAPAGTGTAREVADPQEAQSFPAPDSARGAAAATPVKAGEAAVAAGAPSDAEVKAELAQEHSLEHAAAAAANVQRATPVPGGRSVPGSGSIPIPPNVPEVVQRVIAGANEIADFPYVFGGGHGSFVDSAYDCSASVSYALAAGGLLAQPEASGELESWGVPGPGRYITVYANAGHAYMYVDGVLYDTAGRSGVYASRWQVGSVDNTGFVARHYPGL